MVSDAQAHAAEDRKRRELVDSRNRADTLIYQTEKTLKEFGDKVPAVDRRAIEEATSELRKAMRNDDKAAIDKAIEKLQKVSYKLAEEMYRQKESGPQPGPSASGPQPETDAGKKVDADYTVIDEDKK
jgi:Molecular chaperone